MMNPYKDMTREQLLKALEMFAKAVDPRIDTHCLHCPPDAPEDQYCAWVFSLGE